MILTGLFNDADSAEVAYNMLSARGYTKGEIFYAKLHEKDMLGRIVIGIRPRSQKDAEFFVNEWDTVFQHPSPKAQARRDTGHIPQEEDDRKPSRKEEIGSDRPAKKTVPGVKSHAVYRTKKELVEG
ncbi:MAG: hypothetical protein ACM3RX_01475 [Methanococcaceae archaeon]